MRSPTLVILLVLAALTLATMWALAPPSPSPLPGVGPPPGAPQPATSALEGPTRAAPLARVPAETERVEATAGSLPDVGTTGTLEVTATWGDAPAADVLLTLRWATREHAYLVREQLRTDAEGRATFRDVPPGKWSLRSDRGDRESVEVAPGTQEVRFELEAGVAVRGVVLGPDRAAVAGASVWLTAASSATPTGPAAAC